MKRLFDLFVTLLAAVTWVPALLLSCIAILLSEGRPVFYVSRRRVYRDRTINLLKFRTMRRDADKIANRQTIPQEGVRFLNIPSDSPLYTGVGRVLEALCFTELPQLLHVLSGQMSLVGNRPLPENVVAAIRRDFPQAEERFETPAGLTGPVQLVGRDRLSDEQRLALEIHYCRMVQSNYSMWVDFRILLYTVLVVARLRRSFTFQEIEQLLSRSGTEHPVEPVILVPRANAVGHNVAVQATRNASRGGGQPPMRVALVCPTVGQTRRGYERFVTDLFRVLRPHVDVTLFKGGGEESPSEIVVPHIRRTGILSGLARYRGRYARYRLEFASFAAALWPHLLRGRFDVVHVIDPPLAKPLSAMRRLVRSEYRVVFTDGGPAPFDAAPYADLIHYLTPAAHQAALARGASAERTSMLPVGVDTTQMADIGNRDALRREHGVSPDTFVILAVTTLNRHHKRVDYLIEEIAGLPGDILLWIDASVHPDGDESLLAMAHERLGARFRHTHVASDRIGELYRLADVMVSAALEESFGMAIAEAMCAGLPVIAHDSSHFRWLVNGHAHLIDMQKPGALAARLTHLIENREELQSLVDCDGAMRRFGWEAHREGYLDLYRRACNGQRPEPRAQYPSFS